LYDTSIANNCSTNLGMSAKVAVETDDAVLNYRSSFNLTRIPDGALFDSRAR
jgi:hypothetical protein